MGDLSENFNRDEFRCNCGLCDNDTVDAELIRVLQALRDWAGDRITVTSGIRCSDYNRSVGGSPRSQHLYGKAADIQVRGKTPDEVYNYLNSQYPTRYGLGLYSSWVHIDVRPTHARWRS